MCLIKQQDNIYVRASAGPKEDLEGYLVLCSCIVAAVLNSCTSQHCPWQHELAGLRLLHTVTDTPRTYLNRDEGNLLPDNLIVSIWA
jgi:hypothetical protein